MIGKTRKKTAWYMMAIVTVIITVFAIFLPLNPSNNNTDSIFTNFLNFFVVDDVDSSENTRILIGGDVMLGRSVMAVSLDREDTSHPFREIAKLTNRSDISFVNLENAIVEDCPKVYRNTLKFCGLPSMLDGLVLAGIDVVTLANNHSQNYGEAGYAETIEHLNAKNIKHTNKNLAILEKNGLKFGFLGFDFTVNEPTDEDYKLVSESNLKVDVLILGIHWGVEYTPEPLKSQKEWAKKFVESGADLISGHHPHWIQSSEIIDGVPVYYSLGNLVFDQMEQEKTKTGLLVELTYDENGSLKYTKEIQTYMEKWAQPKVLPSESN